MSEQGRSFDAVAEDYLRSRSGYPSEMLDHIFETARLNSNSLVLEIGCGSGQATIEFSGRGCRIVAIDPAKTALVLLGKRCSDLREIELVHSTFEDFETALKFDMIVCAQAFHWLDLSTAPKRFAALLKPHGHVMLFWHLQDVIPESPQAELYSISSKYFKSFPIMNPPEYGREFIDAMSQVLDRSGLFKELRVLEYPWQQSYKPEMFKALFRSASSFAQLDESSKHQIGVELTDYVEALTDDPVVNYRTCLIEAKIGDI
ncbi:MAG: SAM-dependent methyltransferase [Candidatus Azotimanducaceae bacterium]|jgi:SAM-dependent methyltransferase